MINEFRPRLFCSRCLGFEACRWNGIVIEDRFIEALKVHCDFITECPEKAIGLGVPRKPIRLVRDAGGLRLVQPDTGLDFSKEMTEWAQGFAERLVCAQVDGVILKAKSPTCGLKDAKVYPSTGRVGMIGKDFGMFAGIVAERLKGVPIETEMRLSNARLKEHFLITVFTLARFRAVRQAESAASLIEFHSRHKLLLMTYNQTLMRSLGRIVSNLNVMKLKEIFDEYGLLLRRALARPPRANSHLNTIQHAYGYFKERITPKERAYFLLLLDRYTRGELPISSVLSWLYGNVVRFDIDYLTSQFYFNPFPYELLGIKS